MSPVIIELRLGGVVILIGGSTIIAVGSDEMKRE